MVHQLDGVARHLLRQLARGAQHQRAGHGGLEVTAVGGVFAAGFFGGRLTTHQGLGHTDRNTVLSARNIKGVKAASPKTINVYDILKYNTVVASQAAVNTIEEVYA